MHTHHHGRKGAHNCRGDPFSPIRLSNPVSERARLCQFSSMELNAYAANSIAVKLDCEIQLGIRGR